MKRTRIHHIGVVVPSHQAAENLMTMFGMEVDYTGTAYGSDIIFTKYGPLESPIEFIIPREGVLTKYNNGKGGIHHVAFEVDDIEAVRQEFVAQGKELLEEKAVVGTPDIVVNFLRPRYSEGILFEFVQTVGPIQR